MKVHYSCVTIKKSLYWSGRGIQKLQQSDTSKTFVQQVKIDSAIQVKTAKIESLGEFPLKTHKQKICSKMKTDLWYPHESHTFGRTPKVVMPRPVQSFFVFSNDSKYFLSERSSPLGLANIYFSGSGRKFDSFTDFQS